MAPHFQKVPDHLREPHQLEIAGAGRLYLLAIGIAILLGLLGGLGWIAWSLFIEQVLR
jgi:TM2 domain-containing membrane protein YozV